MFTAHFATLASHIPSGSFNFLSQMGIMIVISPSQDCFYVKMRYYRSGPSLKSWLPGRWRSEGPQFQDNQELLV
jgi:hypothetical protein